MFNRAIASERLPKHLGTDHDPLFRFHCVLANLPVLEIDEIKSVPYAPGSHPFIERLIGTIRREYLGRVFFWNAGDLKRKLAEFKDYYNADRVIARSPAPLRPNVPMRPPLLLLRLIITLGGGTVVVHSRYRWRHNYEFATHNRAAGPVGIRPSVLRTVPRGADARRSRSSSTASGWRSRSTPAPACRNS